MCSCYLPGRWTTPRIISPLCLSTWPDCLPASLQLWLALPTRAYLPRRAIQLKELKQKQEMPEKHNILERTWYIPVGQLTKKSADNSIIVDDAILCLTLALKRSWAAQSSSRNFIAKEGALSARPHGCSPKKSLRMSTHDGQKFCKGQVEDVRDVCRRQFQTWIRHEIWPFEFSMHEVISFEANGTLSEDLPHCTEEEGSLTIAAMLRAFFIL